MTDQIVAMPRPEGLLLVNRETLEAVTLPVGMDVQLRTAIEAKTPAPPSWVADALKAVGMSSCQGRAWPDTFLLRDHTESDIRRVAWEITERCNLRCAHCYLGEKTRRGLPLGERHRLLDKLERMGCLWLQITGGEALADPLFEQTYRAAWERGMMISITTNGLLLSRWIDLFRELPPRRITVSLYGASDDSYAAMTGASAGAFEKVFGGLLTARAAGIRLRVSIIVTKMNAHEVPAMETMLHKEAIEFHTYSKLIPTVQGSRQPLDLAVDLGRETQLLDKKNRCAGGSLSLHVHVSGRASPCKLLPYVSIDLLSEDTAMVKRFVFHSGTRPVTPNCKDCINSGQCTTCAPIFALYKSAGTVPRRVCQYHAA